MPRPSMTAALAAAWHAISHAAKTHANRRDLPDGRRFPVDLRIVGTVGGVPIDEPLVGTLATSPPQTKATSSGPTQAELVAWLFSYIPATRREEIKDYAANRYANAGQLREQDEQHAEREIKAAKLWLAQLRTTQKTTVPGAVTFTPAHDPDAYDEAAA